MGGNGAGWLGKKGSWEGGRGKKKRTTEHGREEVRVHIGAFPNFYIAFVAAPTPRIARPFLCFMKITFVGLVELGISKCVSSGTLRDALSFSP